MGALHKSATSIAFYGDDLDPSEVTAKLGAAPTVGVRKGHQWLTSMGAEKIASTGSWRVVAERREPGDLDGQINALLDDLSDDLPAWRSFAERYRGRVFCGLFLASFNEGVVLHAATIVRIAERGLFVDIDIYGNDVAD